MIADEWVAVALTDDAAVVELLFRLKQAPESFASRPAKLPPLRWGHHQPRSKPATERKERDWTSCSPTTPLSWSSGSGGASSISDGSDESSRPSDLSSGDRSKCVFTNETTATATTKPLRRKKTFDELKQEESLLLNERLHLKKEFASLRVTLNEQKARSESLKRLKLDLHLAHEIEKQVETRERCFVLPDLNMVPDEEDSSFETLYGLS